MKKIAIIFSTLLLASPAVLGQNDLKNWADEPEKVEVLEPDRDSIAGQENIRAQMEEGRVVYNVTYPLPTDISDDRAFTNFIMAVLTHTPGCRPNFLKLEPEEHRLLYHIYFRNLQKTTQLFHSKIACEIKDSQLSVYVHDIDICTLRVFKANCRPFEDAVDVNSEIGKSKLQELDKRVQKFISHCVTRIEENAYKTATHWTAIRKGYSLPGMAEHELLMAMGEPDDKSFFFSEYGSQVTYHYKYEVITVTNGIVTSTMSL